MSGGTQPVLKDLVVLVADKNMEAVMTALLARPPALGIRPVVYDCFVHPRRDPGCLTGASDFLRPQRTFYAHALVMFDHEGSGREEAPSEELAGKVKARLEASGSDRKRHSKQLYVKSTSRDRPQSTGL